MKKQEAIKTFKAGHQKMINVIQQLSEEQMVKEKVLGDWSVKDILAHLSAWSLEAVKEIDRVLKSKPTWPKHYYLKAGENRFNLKEVIKRKNLSLEAVIREWEKSFQVEIKRLEKLSDEEWLHRSNGDKWGDGKPVTVFSLYDYEYQGEQHEAAHAKQISKHFDLN